jgi:hypothetical protein
MNETTHAKATAHTAFGCLNGLLLEDAWLTGSLRVCQGTTTTTGASWRWLRRWLSEPAIL